MVPLRQPVVLALGEEAAAPKALSGFRVLRNPSSDTTSCSDLFVVVPASRLSEVAPLVREANNRGRLRALLVREDLASRWTVQMLERAGLRILRSLLVYEEPAVPSRVTAAWRMGAERELIADAAVIRDRLLVVSCSLERLEVPLERVPALARLRRGDLELTVADDGSYLHWPGPDVHLDLEAIRIVVDPEARQRAKMARLQHDERFGRAVLSVRKARGLRQGDVAGVTSRQIRRIEAGAFPRSATLRLMAEAHGLELGGYLDELADAMGEADADRSTRPVLLDETDALYGKR